MLDYTSRHTTITNNESSSSHDHCVHMGGRIDWPNSWEINCLVLQISRVRKNMMHITLTSCSTSFIKTLLSNCFSNNSTISYDKSSDLATFLSLTLRPTLQLLPDFLLSINRQLITAHFVLSFDRSSCCRYCCCRRVSFAAISCRSFVSDCVLRFSEDGRSAAKSAFDIFLLE